MGAFHFAKRLGSFKSKTSRLCIPSHGGAAAVSNKNILKGVVLDYR